jgi:hypothetical protein
MAANPNRLRGASWGRCLGALVALTLAVGPSQIAFSQNSEVPVVVPVKKAPFHLPIFSNESVILLNVTIPPGRTAGYHRHETDSVFVIVEAARTRGQVLGAEPVEGQAPRGSVSYAGYANKPLTHQVTKVSANPFHVVEFEIVYPDPGRFSPSTRAEVPAYQSVLDNARVRGWRLVLEPGQSAPAITTKAPGVRIVVKGGELVESEPGQPDRGMSLKAADFMWQDANVTRAVSNIGNTPIELDEFELK